MKWIYWHLSVAAYSCTTAVSQDDICASGNLSQDLITETPRLKDVTSFHASRCSDDSKVRNFEGISLGYVTPWNNHGYDIAKRLGHKFTHISPVWLQVLHAPDMKYKMSGTHDIDKEWVNKVKEKGVKMVPRVLFDGWTPQHIQELEAPAARDRVINLIINTVKKHSFDGIVLEGWMQLISSGHMKAAVEFVKIFSSKMQNLGKDFILVIPPIRGSQTIFGSKHFDLLSETVTAFSIMTYDFSGHQRQPGPNSPLDWMKDCVQLVVPQQDDPRRAKILLGLNFYGNHFTSGGPEPITGNQFLDLIKLLKGKMKLDKESMENFVDIKTKSGRHSIYYPSLFSINKRIQLAQELGVGIAIWELGQGLDYFYELL